MTDAAKAGRPVGEIMPETIAKASAVDPKADHDVCTPVRGVKRRTSGLGDQAQIRIGNSLRSLYDGIVQQPVPDRFRELIERLESQEPKTP